MAKDEVAGKRGQPKQDKAKIKEHVEKLVEELEAEKDKEKPK
jgi:hypothetical protein